MKKSILLLISISFLFQSCEIYLDDFHDRRNEYSGTYDVREESQTYGVISHYYFTIKKSARFDEVRIFNFYDVGLEVDAIVDYDRLTIPLQVVNGYEIEGVGNKYGESVEITFSIRDLNHPRKATDFCIVTARR